MLPSPFNLEDAVKNPCGYPASAIIGGTYVVNNKAYTDPNVKYLPCNGIDSGKCIYESELGQSYCGCAERPDLNPDRNSKQSHRWEV